MQLAEKIKSLKRDKDVVILSHYYTDGLVQDVADYIGDSYYLSKIATSVPQNSILFCGVRFMGESAKILSPEKSVLLADDTADCPMAHMIDSKTIKDIKAQYQDIAVVCYINSTAETKSFSDVCVTSSNALKIVSRLPQKNILFVPDNNLGTYLASKIPEKNFIFHKGYCPIHQGITKEDFFNVKKAYPHAKSLAHPECTFDLLQVSDFVGSTSEIIDYATASEEKDFILCTEMGILHQLHKKNPEKNFYPVNNNQYCSDMKLITLEKIYKVLTLMDHEITIDENLRKKAQASLIKMHELAK